MPLTTTTIGAYPKPIYVSMPDWFRASQTTLPDLTAAYNDYLQSGMTDQLEVLDRATQEVVRTQVKLGIEIPTDGEVRRENYVYYHCRHLNGFDFANLIERMMRGGSWRAYVPLVSGPVSARREFLTRDWRVAQSATKRPVKITLPGPLTIIDSVVDGYYQDERQLGADLAEAINSEILALAEAGCRYIQVDEPVFAREPEKALAFGLDLLEHCFHKLPKAVTSTVHICCGYPDVVDNEDYPKADPAAYFQLAEALECATVKAVSIEDAHRPNDLSLLERFSQTTVILGVIAIARSQVEPVDEIVSRLNRALQHIEPNRLMVAPDCGLGMLDRRIVVEKLKNMVTAARAVV
jgi:5-methyltetrahydropteroyltriglutamate--homocysteine methyltransferase